MIEVPGEVLTLVVGGALGLICARIDGTARRRTIWLVASVLGGMLVSLLNGELLHWPELLIFDVPTVSAVTLLVSLLLRQLKARPVRSR